MGAGALARLGCGVMIVVALGGRAGPARAAASDAPLGLRSGGTLGSLFLELEGADARVQARPELAVRWALANDWSLPVLFLSGGRRVLLQTDEQSDALTASLRLPWARLLGPGPDLGGRGLWERLSTALELRLVAHSGGWTDGPIETWHRVIGSTNFMRASAPRNSVNVLAVDQDTGQGLRLRSPRLALGDFVVRTQLLALEGGVSPSDPGRARFAASVRLDAKLPLGNPWRLGGSGGWDAGGALLGTAELTPWLTLHALVGVTAVSPLPAAVPLETHPLRGVAELSAVLRLGELAIVVEDRITGPLLRRLAPVPEVPTPAVEASSYYGAALTENRIGVGVRRGPLTLWFSEDWTPGTAPRSGGPANWFHNSNAPDFALGLDWVQPL